MEVREALQVRRSVRRFTKEKVSEENIEELLHAAMSGPSACNAVPWEFYVVTKEEEIEKLRRCSKYTGMEAPLGIVVCGNMTNALPEEARDFWIQDTSAATENILLAAVDIGLGSVWCGIHPMAQAEDNVRKALGLPEEMVPLNIIWLGHPAENPKARDQYDKSKVHYIK